MENMFFVRVMVGKRCVHYWRTVQPPAVTDSVSFDGQVYLIRSRLWRQAEDILPEYASHLSFIDAFDGMAVVDLICERPLGIRDGV